MQRQRCLYLIRVQYLGFRYSGWQNQPGQKTVEAMLVKTLRYVLPNRRFKILGAGRTDAKVSALDMAFQLFLDGAPLCGTESFLETFNLNLPPDIRAITIKEADGSFNIIKDARLKEYVYLFSFGQKNHPFCAPFLANVMAPLDLDAMKEGAKCFKGTHDFSAYTARLKEGANTVRTLMDCCIRDNGIIKASFFPEKTYALHVKASGFMRYQVRMLMGALIQLGKGELSVMDIKKSLSEKHQVKLTYVAPASGLLLHQLDF